MEMKLVFNAQGGAPRRREAQISERKKLKKRLTDVWKSMD
jgi:hypothetical protein